MRRIFIVEILNHHDSFETIARIAQSLENFEIVVTTKENVFNKTSQNFRNSLDKGNIRCILENDSRRILLTLLTNIKREDVIIINTLESLRNRMLQGFVTSLRKKKVTVIAGIHNIHYFFPELLDKEQRHKIIEYLRYEFTEFFKTSRIYPILKILRKPLPYLILKAYNMMSKKVLKGLSGIYLVADYLKCPGEFRKTREELPCVKLSTRISDINFLKERSLMLDYLLKSTRIVFTIPGTILRSRRDYDIVINAVRRLRRNEIKVILLGKLVESDIGRIIDSSSIKGKFEYFNDFISEEIFKNNLLRTHFVLAPIKFIPPYGIFKASGSIGDALAHGIPIIIPKNFAPHYDFGGSCLRYNESEDLINVLEKAINSVRNGEYTKMFKNAINKAQNYSLENLSGKFLEFLEEVLSNDH